MSRTFARGTHAMGECARSGKKMRLKDMVYDGYYPWLLVDPAWREERHPQERLEVKPDPIALERPAPQLLAAPDAPVLSIEASGADLALSWSAPDAPASQIAEYEVYRSVDGADFSLLATVAVERDWKGKATSDRAYTDDTVDTGAHSYSYYVLAVPEQGPPSEKSNTVSS